MARINPGGVKLHGRGEYQPSDDLDGLRFVFKQGGAGLTEHSSGAIDQFVSALEILEHLSEASAEELALVKETAEELLSLQTADASECAEINAALAEAEADIAAGRLHSPEEIRRALEL